MLKNIFKGLIDFILPPICVSCENPPEDNSSFLCKSCYGKLERFSSSHPWLVEAKSSGIIDSSFSLYKFIKDTPIQHLLHSLKYEKMKTIGKMLGREIGRNLASAPEYNYAVPVPLHKSKKRERTYNQSDYICLGIKDVTGLEVLPDLLIRNRYTGTQTKLTKSERVENVRGAFVVNNNFKNSITGKNIMIADDVITTGSTILECARVLKDNGAGNVLVCSAAYDLLD